MSRHRASRPRLRRRSAIADSALTVLGGAAALWLPSANADQPAAGPHPKVQRSLDDLVRGNGFPAALASVRDEKGHTRDYTA
ncbi:serine hydrolase, partial [Streptomyces coelicoflavus]